MMDTTMNHLIFCFSVFLVVYAQLVYGQSAGVVIQNEDPVTGLTGADIVLMCNSFQAGTNLTWSFKDGDVIVNNDKYDVTNTATDSTLIIKNAQLSDNGEYSCRSARSTARVTVNLDLDAKVSIKDVEGGFHLAKDTVMQCVADQNTTFTWSKNDKDLAKGKNDLNGDGVDDLEVNDLNQIVLLSADPVLGGEYTCTIDLGSTTKSVSQAIAGDLDVFAPKSIKVSEGEDGRMECRATSIPAATITWSVNGTEITPGDDKYDVETKDAPAEPNTMIGTLIVTDVSLDDGRPVNYTCSATNGVHTKEEVIILRIRDRLAALWPFIGIVSEVIILIIIILIHEACTKGEDIGEVEDDEEDHLLQKNRSITRDGERETRMRGTNN